MWIGLAFTLQVQSASQTSEKISINGKEHLLVDPSLEESFVSNNLIMVSVFEKDNNTHIEKTVGLRTFNN